MLALFFGSTGTIGREAGWLTYLPTCLLRKALSLAVHGLMMLSEGEMKVLFLEDGCQRGLASRGR